MPIGLCESCRHEPAEFIVCWTSKAGRREERSLCGTCTRDRERILFGDSGLLVTELLQFAPGQRSAGHGEENRTKVCPRCGNTLANIEEAGEVGCSMCYAAFRDEVDRVIRELHGRPP